MEYLLKFIEYVCCNFYNNYFELLLLLLLFIFVLIYNYISLPGNIILMLSSVYFFGLFIVYFISILPVTFGSLIFFVFFSVFLKIIFQNSIIGIYKKLIIIQLTTY